ncbi:tRNA-guanine transglycosylase [Legionella saoudiensis]|uniref:tRNA-guanine transglycosylase n=1 Tax=Legionella saoudiensis TaxID=1750561 RepID=UPI00072FDD6F|nr:tRNA-guanine transglycosylase [Legionella saoudiensis]
MLATTQSYIPVGTSEAGLCLTAANWQEAKVNTLSFSLEFLLYKPGIALLKKISLSKYLGWSGAIILNASSLSANREGTYLLKSPFDGSKTKLSAMELVELIVHLNPDAVILPKKILQDCPQLWTILKKSIMPFFNAEELSQYQPSQEHGVYFHETDASLLEKWAQVPRYVMGDFNAESINHLRAQGVEYIETDAPVNAAFNGKVYSRQGEIDLTNKVTEIQFEPIDSTCTCPVCTQQFTKAYFHHLIEHTPLLCQRFLIQHNVFWMAN